MFFAASPVLSAIPSAASSISPKSVAAEPIEELKPPIFIPNKPPIQENNLCMAMTSAFMYGRTFDTIGRSKLPIVLAKFAKLACNKRNWFAGCPIVDAISPHAYFVDWSKIIVRRSALSCCPSFAILASMPNSYSFSCRFTLRILTPYLSKVRLIPTMPDAISCHTSSNFRFFTEAKSAPIIVKALDNFSAVSEATPMDEAICPNVA